MSHHTLQTNLQVKLVEQPYSRKPITTDPQSTTKKTYLTIILVIFIPEFHIYIVTKITVKLLHLRCGYGDKCCKFLAPDRRAYKVIRTTV